MNKKLLIIWRSTFLTLLILSAVLTAYLTVNFVINTSDEESLWVHIFTGCVLLIGTLLQAIALIKGLAKKKPDTVFHDIAFENNDDVNKGPFIIVGVLGIIAFIVAILSAVLRFYLTDKMFIFDVLLMIFVYTFINCLYYVLYILLYRKSIKNFTKFYSENKLK